MDFNLLLENWGNLGATGVISLFFGFLITNLIKSQNAQSESLDKIQVDIAKSESSTDNVQSILLKLLDRIQRESEQQNDERNRRHEAMLDGFSDLEKSFSILEKDLAKMDGILSRMNGSGK
jgi:septal ring factor EnvC (AmiA/AmiB activator)